MLTATLFIIVGCALLAWGADRFVTGATVVARNLGVPPLVIGIVLVGFATSLPEMLVSAMASWHGNPVLAVGNAIGSNITNIGLAVGIATLVAPLQVRSHLIKREYPILIGVMCFVFLLLLDGFLSRNDGILMMMLFTLLVIYMTYLTRTKKYQQDALVAEVEEVITTGMSTKRAIYWWILGLLLLLISSRMLVYGAVVVAKHFGVSDLIIGLTIVALGTSLPEIAAAIASTLKNEPDMVLGNVIGSNIFNLLPVMIMPAMIAPTKVPIQVLTRDYTVMFVMTLMLLIFSLGVRGRGRINRLEGGLLVVCYCGYITYLIVG